MVKLSASSRLCQRLPPSGTRSIQYPLTRSYSDAIPSVKAIQQGSLSRQARARIEGVTAVQNLNSNRQQRSPNEAEVQAQNSQNRQNRSGSSSDVTSRSVSLSRSPSNSDNGAPDVLDLRSLGAAPRPGSTSRPLLRRVGGQDRGATRGLLAGRAGARSGGPRVGGLGRRSRPGTGRRESAAADGEAEEDKGDKRTEAEKQYEAEKLEAASRPKDYSIDVPTPESLLALGPQMPLSNFGSLAIIDATLRSIADPHISRLDATRISDVARKLIDGEYVYFRSEEEKEAVLDIAHHRVKSRARQKEDKTNEIGAPEAPAFEGVDDGEKKEAISRLFEGKYRTPVDSSRKGLLQDILRQARRNETYHEKDEEILINKLGPLMPGSKPQGRASTGK